LRRLQKCRRSSISSRRRIQFYEIVYGIDLRDSLLVFR
jgi:hypothetical protein